MSSYEYLLSDISTIKGIGTKIGKLFRKKNINTIFDLLWNLPRDFVDRSNVYPINELQVGKIQTVTVVVKKYNFPRIRNLPNKVICEDETGKLDCIFFNSYEGYIRKILPLNAKVTISGKIGYYNKKYQITNPTHLSEDPNSVKKIDKSYSLTEGLNNKLYNKIIQEVLKNLPNFLDLLALALALLYIAGTPLNKTCWYGPIKPPIRKPDANVCKPSLLNISFPAAP